MLLLKVVANVTIITDYDDYYDYIFVAVFYVSLFYSIDDYDFYLYFDYDVLVLVFC